MKILRTPLLLAASLIYLPQAGAQPRPAALQTAAAPPAAGEIPTVPFCEVLTHPRLYFDKTVRLTATFTTGDEGGVFLMDERCWPGDSVGLDFANAAESQRETMRRAFAKYMSGEYGNGRAMLTVVGRLRNISESGFVAYRYRFDVVRLEDMSREDDEHKVVNYEGLLRAGMNYRATVRGDARNGLALVPPPRPAFHQGLLVEWTNLDEFPALRRLRHGQRERRIVFSVISDRSVWMTDRRWDRTVECKIVRVE
jgi:hypothetical protein